MSRPSARGSARRVRAPAARRTAALLLFVVFGSQLAAVPDPASGYASRMIFTRDSQIWFADHDALNAAPVPGTTAPIQPAVSPNGQELVWSDNYSLFTANLNGSNRREIFRAGGFDLSGRAWNPKFSPDGTQIVFSIVPAGGGGSPDIAVINVDGTGYRTVAAWTNAQDSPTFTPNGQKIVFHSRSGPTGAEFKNLESAIYMVDPSGANPVRLTKADALLGTAIRPTVSPDGQEVAFQGAKPTRTSFDYDVYVTSTSGTNLRRRQITTSAGDERTPSWRADGRRILYSTGDYATISVNPDGSDPRSLLTSASRSYSPSYRPPSTFVTEWDFLAAEHRPLMLFDEGEHWRPLEVGRFFAETHRICTPDRAICEPISSPATLRRPEFHRGTLDVNGEPGQEDTYRSPDAACLVGTLFDCDAGSASAAYYHVVGPSPRGYTYIDYWYFYRYNDNPDVSGTDHESDWEGVSVAPSPNSGGTFDFVSFSGHGRWFSYLRDNLACDEFGGGSCGTEGARAGRRANTYVAGGSHANYAEPCGNNCFQTNGAVPEMDHGGERPWGTNNDAKALRKLPPNAAADTPWTSGPMEWTDWPGNWTGTPDHTIAGPAGADPNRAHFFAPWDSDCADGDDCPAQGASARRSPRVRSLRSASCRSWFGPGVSVLACDEAALEEALSRRRLGRRGDVSITARRSRSDDAPGVAQMMGPALRPGKVARLTRRAARSSGHRLLIRIRNRRGDVYVAEFPGLAGGGDGAIRVAATRGARSARREPPRVTLSWSRGGREVPARVTLVHRAKRGG